MHSIWLAIDKSTGKINVVAWEKSETWDAESQVFVEVSIVENSDTTVTTPDGDMPFVEALWSRAGAFAYDFVTGEFVHDPDWREANA